MKKQIRIKLTLIIGIILVLGSLFIINKVTLNARIYNRCELIMREQPYEPIETDEDKLNVIDKYVMRAFGYYEANNLIHACEIVAEQYNMTVDEVYMIYKNEYIRRNSDIK